MCQEAQPLACSLHHPALPLGGPQAVGQAPSPGVSQHAFKAWGRWLYWPAQPTNFQGEESVPCQEGRFQEEGQAV